MKIFKQLLFAIGVMICFSITASAQKQDDKKPKNPDPPKIVVAPKQDEKKPKENEKPKDDKKKPQSSILKPSAKDEMILV